MKGLTVGHLCMIIYLVFPSVLLIAVVIKFMNENLCCLFLSLFSTFARTKLLESESMNESLRRQVGRLSSRSPFPTSTLSPAPGHPPGSSPAPMSMEAEMTDVLRRAKLDIERLKKKERRQRRMR